MISQLKSTLQRHRLILVGAIALAGFWFVPLPGLSAFGQSGTTSVPGHAVTPLTGTNFSPAAIGNASVSLVGDFGSDIYVVYNRGIANQDGVNNTSDHDGIWRVASDGGSEFEWANMEGRAPTAIAFPEAGSGYPNAAFVATSSNPDGPDYCGGGIVQITSSGSITAFSNEASGEYCHDADGGPHNSSAIREINSMTFANGADGYRLIAAGTFWMGSDFQNGIVSISPTGNITPIVTGDDARSVIFDGESTFDGVAGGSLFYIDRNTDTIRSIAPTGDPEHPWAASTFLAYLDNAESLQFGSYEFGGWLFVLHSGDTFCETGCGISKLSQGPGGAGDIVRTEFGTSQAGPTFAGQRLVFRNSEMFIGTDQIYKISSDDDGSGHGPDGRMRADGRLAGNGNESLRFTFDVTSTANSSGGRFSFWTNDPQDRPRLTNVFDATSITSVTFSNDPGFTPGNHSETLVDSVTFSGAGDFNDQTGYTFDVTATDQGEPGKDHDTFSLTVRNGNGDTVYNAAGLLIGGNIQSRRLPGRHMGPILLGGPSTVSVLEATGPDGAMFGYAIPNATAMDGSSAAVDCTPASGGIFPLGITHGTCTATDNQGNTTTARFRVAVYDTTAPTLNIVSPTSPIEATGPNGAVVTYSVTSTDAVDVTPNVTCSRASGAAFHLGTTTVTCTARDGRGNRASMSFDVTVVDTTAPAVSGTPANIVVEATKPEGAKVTFAKPTATDAADNSVPVVCVSPSGTIFPIGTTQVNCTATDNSGNSTVTSFTVTVQDTVAPTIKLTKPADGGSYRLNQSVIANFSCADTGSGIASCVGTVADGAAINTSSLGTKSFTVTATDNVGHVTVTTVNYIVRP